MFFYVKRKVYSSDEYIENYLNPDKLWKKTLSTYEKMDSICNQDIDYEEIAQEINRMPYEAFLRTPYWKAITRKKMEDADFRCQICNSDERLITHHRTYDIHGYESKNLKELIVLCDGCHHLYHTNN